VEGSFVYQIKNKEPKVYKVPITPKEAMKSALIGMSEKANMAQFTAWVAKVDRNDKKTFVAGIISKKTLELETMKGKDFFAYWKLSQSTVEFLTHVCALYRDESYMDLPAIDIVMKMQLYLTSMTRFPDMTSPYLYPLYGLGELPQAFARLAAVHGGTYMLNRDLEGEPVFGPDDLKVQYDAEGKCSGVKVKDVVARAKIVICDPSYMPEKCRKEGSVVRAIALLSQPLANTDGCESCQVICPARQVGRKNDLYLFCCSASHKVSPKDRYVAFLSTNVEGEVKEGMTAEALAHRELAAGLQLLPSPVRIFYDVYDLMLPVQDGKQDQVFISQSFDPTSHFETAISDVLAMYTRITGAELQLSDSS